MIQEQNHNHSNKKEIFSEIRDLIYKNTETDINISEVKISLLKNPNIVNEIKNLKIIELDNLEDFLSYVNYDHYLIFKFNNFYYFCDTELTSYLEKLSLIKMIDFSKYLRKDKINNIEKFN